MRYKVITISREFGSGGHFIGEQVAKRLNFDFYDHKIVEQIASNEGMGEETVERMGEELKTKKSLFSLFDAKYEEEITDEIFEAQRNIINEVAKKGNCVIVGRCADYILKDDVDVLHVYIYADHTFKVQRLMDLSENNKEMVEKQMIEKNEKRKAYYEHYTNRKWHDRSNYDICFNSSKLGISDCIHAIVKFVED